MKSMRKRWSSSYSALERKLLFFTVNSLKYVIKLIVVDVFIFSGKDGPKEKESEKEKDKKKKKKKDRSKDKKKSMFF